MASPAQAVCNTVNSYEDSVKKQNTDYGKTYGHLMLPDSISLMSRMTGKDPQVDNGAVEKTVSGAQSTYGKLSDKDKKEVPSSVRDAATGQYDTPDKALANQSSLSDLRSACRDVPREETATPSPATPTQTVGVGKQLQTRACQMEEATGGDCSKVDSSSTLGQERLKKS